MDRRNRAWRAAFTEHQAKLRGDQNTKSCNRNCGCFTLAVVAPANAQGLWIGAPGFGVGIGVGPTPYYGRYWGGPYWGADYAYYGYEPSYAWSYAYEPAYDYDSYAYLPDDGYAAYSYGPRLRTYGYESGYGYAPRVRYSRNYSYSPGVRARPVVIPTQTLRAS